MEQCQFRHHHHHHHVHMDLNPIPKSLNSEEEQSDLNTENKPETFIPIKSEITPQAPSHHNPSIFPSTSATETSFTTQRSSKLFSADLLQFSDTLFSKVELVHPVNDHFQSIPQLIPRLPSLEYNFLQVGSHRKDIPHRPRSEKIERLYGNMAWSPDSIHETGLYSNINRPRAGDSSKSDIRPFHSDVYRHFGKTRQESQNIKTESHIQSIMKEIESKTHEFQRLEAKFLKLQSTSSVSQTVMNKLETGIQDLETEINSLKERYATSHGHLFLLNAAEHRHSGLTMFRLDSFVLFFSRLSYHFQHSLSTLPPGDQSLFLFKFKFFSDFYTKWIKQLDHYALQFSHFQLPCPEFSTTTPLLEHLLSLVSFPFRKSLLDETRTKYGFSDTENKNKKNKNKTSLEHLIPTGPRLGLVSSSNPSEILSHLFSSCYLSFTNGTFQSQFQTFHIVPIFQFFTLPFGFGFNGTTSKTITNAMTPISGNEYGFSSDGKGVSSSTPALLTLFFDLSRKYSRLKKDHLQIPLIHILFIFFPMIRNNPAIYRIIFSLMDKITTKKSNFQISFVVLLLDFISLLTVHSSSFASLLFSTSTTDIADLNKTIQQSTPKELKDPLKVEPGELIVPNPTLCVPDYNLIQLQRPFGRFHGVVALYQQLQTFTNQNSDSPVVNKSSAKIFSPLNLCFILITEYPPTIYCHGQALQYILLDSLSSNPQFTIQHLFGIFCSYIVKWPWSIISITPGFKHLFISRIQEIGNLTLLQNSEFFPSLLLLFESLLIEHETQSLQPQPHLREKLVAREVGMAASSLFFVVLFLFQVLSPLKTPETMISWEQFLKLSPLSTCLDSLISKSIPDFSALETQAQSESNISDIPRAQSASQTFKYHCKALWNSLSFLSLQFSDICDTQLSNSLQAKLEILFSQ